MWLLAILFLVTAILYSSVGFGGGFGAGFGAGLGFGNNFGGGLGNQFGARAGLFPQQNGFGSFFGASGGGFGNPFGSSFNQGSSLFAARGGAGGFNFDNQRANFGLGRQAFIANQNFGSAPFAFGNLGSQFGF